MTRAIRSTAFAAGLVAGYAALSLSAAADPLAHLHPDVAETPDFSTPAEELEGRHNPEELSVASTIQRAIEGETSMVVCMQGYFVVKSGAHGEGREIVERCADAGWTAAMHWRSYMDTNGLGAPEDPESAAEWDRRAAEAGDPIGQLNYGLDLLRGHGVETDREKARRYVDQAADAGIADAIRVRDADYDPGAGTPDADAWKYDDGRHF